MKRIVGITDRMTFVVIFFPSLFLTFFFPCKDGPSFFCSLLFSLSTKKQPIELNSGITGPWESMSTGKLGVLRQGSGDLSMF